MAAAVATFGGVDIVINNASALNLAGTLDLRRWTGSRPPPPSGSSSCPAADQREGHFQLTRT
ncbi:hypothetical protein [Pseudonocardia kunmingensis]|uniref:hypothetical protein n=1 Tax=Pseudonocardia kunmingensis TaxID=630975 RepID=UPI001B863DF2|nr:hypothetical protein [Pseudonocardia kunmingensis]